NRRRNGFVYPDTGTSGSNCVSWRELEFRAAHDGDLCRHCSRLDRPVLPGVEASLVNEGTAAALQAVTNETGEFLIDFVPPGTYTLKLGLPGFKGFESRGIPLGAAQSVRRTYTLEVGAITDNVTVTGEAPLVNTLSPEQRLTLDTLQV